MRTINHIALGAAFALAAPAAANHVDFISDGPFDLTTSGAEVTQTTTGSSANILGGTRNVSLIRDGGFGGTISATLPNGGTAIRVDNSSVAAGTLVLSYPNIGGSDFTTMWDSIAVSIPVLENSFPAGDGEINLSVSVADSSTMATVFANGTGLAPGRIEDPGTFYFMFDDFVGVDFTDVQSLSVTFDTAIIGTVFEIDGITRELVNAPPPAPVPGPAGFALFGLGALGIGLARRKRS